MFSFLIPLLDSIKIVIASVTSVIFLGLSGLTLAGSAVALAVSSPLFIIFSPILVPATLATTLLATGLTGGFSLGVAAIGLIMGLIKTAEGTPLNLLSGGYGVSFGGRKYSGKFGKPGAGGIDLSGTITFPGGNSLSGNVTLDAPPAGSAPAGGGAPAAGGAPS